MTDEEYSYEGGAFQAIGAALVHANTTMFALSQARSDAAAIQNQQLSSTVGRQLRLAATKLEEAKMWARAASEALANGR